MASGVLYALAHVLYPKTCYACGTALFRNENMVCEKCLVQMPELHILDRRDNPIEKIFWGRASVHQAAAIFRFSKGATVQRLIHQVKYKKQKELGIFLGELMGIALSKHQTWQSIDYLVPVPLHPKKEKIRGYNQARLLADGIAKHMPATVSSDNLIRNIFTETQTKKSRLERWKNTAGIFLVQNPAEFAGKHILLIDDIITTGSTLEACVNTIKTAVPDSRISIVTFAAALN